jgi:hypothetical protein
VAFVAAGALATGAFVEIGSATDAFAAFVAFVLTTVTALVFGFPSFVRNAPIVFLYILLTKNM